MDMVKQGVDDGQQQHGMDPFAALFGGGGRQQRTNRGPDAQVYPATSKYFESYFSTIPWIFEFNCRSIMSR